MHSFELYMPTRLVYGADSIEKLAAAAAPYGKRALITYGGGSVVRSGLLERVKKALAGFEVVEFSGIEPNPRVSSVNAAAKLAREQKVDFIVAVGGGSVIDASKAIAAAVSMRATPGISSRTAASLRTLCRSFRCSRLRRPAANTMRRA